MGSYSVKKGCRINLLEAISKTGFKEYSGIFSLDKAYFEVHIQNGSEQEVKRRIKEKVVEKSHWIFLRWLLVFLLCGHTERMSAQYDSIMHSTGYRTYLLHLPPAYVQGTPMPMLIAMHGGFGWGSQLENQSQLSVKADNEGFIVVYPEGVRGNLNIRTWNAGGCCGYAMNNNIDDVGFISTLLDSLINKLTIDTNRIYATGMSNGGFMSYRLACELSGRIAAIAPVAASMNVQNCTPTRPVPVIHFHSYLDFNVPYTGGIGAGTSNHYNPPLDSVMHAWSLINSCQTPDDTIRHDSSLTHIKWDNCSCDHHMELYLTADGGHSWPGGNSTGVGDPVSMLISANDLMWDFFQQFSLQCQGTGLEPVRPATFNLEVIPSHREDLIHIKTDKFLAGADLTLFNVYGQVVYRHEYVSGDHFSINAGNLSGGIYFVTLSEPGGDSGTAKFLLD